MDPLLALAVLLGIVAVGVVAGVALRRSSGRVRGARGARTTIDDLGVPDDLDVEGRTLLVQFSTATCTYCGPTAKALRQWTADRADVRHVEVDLDARPDVADRFNVLQTPTTLVVDPGLHVRARIGGPPRRDSVLAVLDQVTGGPRAR